MSWLKWLNIFNPLIDLADRWWLARLQRKASKSEIKEEILDDVGFAQQIEINNIPLVKDVITMTELLKHIGSNIKINLAYKN